MITVQLTNGVGNNLFQYVYARLKAGSPNALNVVPPFDGYYGLQELKAMGLTWNETLSAGHPVDLKGHFDDYEHYIDHIDEIRSWFSPITGGYAGQHDLVVHMRLGDRLMYKNSYETGMCVKPETWQKVIQELLEPFSNVFIVTDMPVWKEITVTELDNMKFHTDISPNLKIEDLRIAVDYFNSLVRALDIFYPEIVESDTIAEDFDIMRSFNKILFQHSTLAWWAAALSHASKVGVYGPWRPCKKDNNKNLGKTPLPGWFSWQ